MTIRPMEVFWGTGGVGKTTLAASRALFLSGQDKKILLVAIDPSRRLGQIFNIKEDSMGKIVKVDSLEILIFNPEATFKRILGGDVQDGLNNRIMNIIMRPYGGMNEIMAILELQHQLGSGRYDTIILDTPPGKHFIDFVQGAQKINKFFDKKFIEIVKYFIQGIDIKNKNIFNVVAKTGMDKILKYMGMVTGEQFMEEFINVIWGLYKNKKVFMSALDFEKKLLGEEFCRWFLVTSAGRKKLKEIVFLHDGLKKDFCCDEYLIVNKSVKSHLDNWTVEDGNSLYEIKKSMQDGEMRMIQLAKASFEKILVFPEILSASPKEHVGALASYWKMT